MYERRNGMLSIYLDFYPGYRDPETMKVTRRKALGIYIYSTPKTPTQKSHNAAMLEKAEAIRCRIYEEVVDDRFGFFNKGKLDEDFLAYYRKVAKRKNVKWQFVYKHFARFMHDKCTFGEINVDLCRRFQDYLMSTTQLRNSGQPIKINSVAGYWSTFRAFLRILYRDHLIKENVNDYLDRIEFKNTVKETLSLEELNQLAATPCQEPMLKSAALFSCLTGLRRSDLINLTWESVRTYSDGGHYLAFIVQKTKEEIKLPISDQAYRLLPEKHVKSDKVFYGLKAEQMIFPRMKKWLVAAGITKHITFHCFRHTFASLQIELGTDIYTVKDLLGHKFVETTQVYARHSGKNKRDAVTRIMLTDVNEADKGSNP